MKHISVSVLSHDAADSEKGRWERVRGEDLERIKTIPKVLR